MEAGSFSRILYHYQVEWCISTIYEQIFVKFFVEAVCGPIVNQLDFGIANR